MTLTKSDIIDHIYHKSGLPKHHSTKLLETLLETMKQTLESGEDIMISGFGKLCVKNKNTRRGRNPATGEDFALGARRVITFKCSPVLGNKMNGKR
ncbi:MAG: integration host factor subunit alpha [Deltaproteobacteria bacterium]|nr:integration host factor subunit alpha [Deltaproteobacteria bacterium]